MSAFAPFPQWFAWDGKAMIPDDPRTAERIYVAGERYHLEHREERSTETHNHEFAWLHDAWLNLPEPISYNFPTSEHLRKRALIDAGWYDEEIVDAGSNAAALRVASFIRGKDDFAMVIVRGHFVVVRSAKSQSRRSMNRKDFQASKTAIMDVIAAMLGVSPDTLEHNSGQAA